MNVTAPTGLPQTPWMNQPEIPWNVYPRPQMKRNSFFCLNGLWQFSCNGQTLGEVRVPYPPESPLSGVGRITQPEDVLEYSRTFSLPESFEGKRVVLHFGAVDQLARVWLNDHLLGEHEGGYLPFSFEVTDCLQEENTLRVQVRDSLDHDYPYGKQRYDRGGMWYTPVSGIWQTVWMEAVPDKPIEAVTIDADLTGATITIRGGAEEKVLTCDGRRYVFSGERIRICPKDPQLWSPENPRLYTFTVESGDDRVESYFALRQIEIRPVDGVPRILLNGKPYFFHGVLDQGYFSDGIFLPGSPEGYAFDVRTMKSLGFNTLRKHIKIEPEQFYYECDRQGMIVFQDLVNSGDYHFFTDTLLPNAGILKGITHKVSPRQREIFATTAKQTLAHLHNHPCILYYTLFNEGWGQHDEQKLFEEMKAQEPNRVWDATSGWFFNCDSDVLSRHIYFAGLGAMKADHRPLVLSEFGGYSCTLPEHSFCPDKTYGYKKFHSPQEMEQALKKLYEEKILPKVEKGLCAAILTQLSDVEEETNGLVTYDRRKVKVSKEIMTQIAEKLQKAL